LGIEHDFEVPSPAPVPRSGCGLGLQPPPPPSVAVANAGDARLVFATTSEDFTGRNDAGEVVGYDLDGVCSCDARDKSKHAGQESCVRPDSGVEPCDADGGIDNAAARLTENAGAVNLQLKGDIDD